MYKRQVRDRELLLLLQLDSVVLQCITAAAYVLFYDTADVHTFLVQRCIAFDWSGPLPSAGRWRTLIDEAALGCNECLTVAIYLS